MIPNTKRGFWELLWRSIMENDRISPRLLTTFAFSTSALLLLRHGAVTKPVLLNGTVVTGWPPEYIWTGLIFLVVSLLLGGKAAETYAKIKLEGPPPASDTTINAETAPVSAENVTVTNPPAGQPEA